ncbi:MAG: RES domain-containing protein [Flavobacteriales bacterium]|nr:RES domain-containing protein [Flavobacteriales bacterium]
MLLYRLGKTKHAHKLDGVGARDFPGRWNSFGNAMVYSSESSSTTVLEVRVHAKKLPRDLSMTTIEVPDNATVLRMKATELPNGWNWMRYLNTVRAVGDDFLNARKYLILRVPSAVDPKAWNYLLNPFHPEMARVQVVKVEPYSLDPRLFIVKK